MRFFGKLGILLLLFATPSFGADVAILQNGFSIRHERREVIGPVTRLYLGADGGYVDINSDQIERFEKDMTPAAAAKLQNLNEAINTASGRHHLDPDLISSVIRAESGFNANAVSNKGAQGLMQIMPGTASQLGLSNPFDPGSNVEAGTRYLRELLERYNFDLIKALAAYNAGPQRVEQYRGVPPYHETRAYVAGIIRDFNRKKLAEEKAATTAKSSVKTPATPAPKPQAAATSQPAQ